MHMPQVLILARNDFHRRLMTDLVACNEMGVRAAAHADALEQVVSGTYRADVVVIDCHMERGDVDRALGRLRDLPPARRPRVLGVSPPAELAGDQAFAECLGWPIDIGDFARRVKDQAQAQVLALEV
ncbi:MAG: hypothetical protein H6807_10975 [Planctomycetes bacterium]|nr:hypothetical protein [Planctomycetota bacterium]